MFSCSNLFITIIHVCARFHSVVFSGISKTSRVGGGFYLIITSLKCFHNATWSVIFIMPRLKSDFYFQPEKPCFKVKDRGRKGNYFLSNCSKSKCTFSNGNLMYIFICIFAVNHYIRFHMPLFLLLLSTFICHYLTCEVS